MRRLLTQLLMLGGLSAGLLSCALTWFAVPVGAEPLAISPTTIHVAQPPVTAAYRILSVIAVAALIITWSVGKLGSAGLVVACLWLAALLTYPYAVMNWQPAAAGSAAWLEAQHRNLVWSSGDLNISDGHRMDGVMDRVFLTQAPRNVNPVEMGAWQLSEFSLARLPDLTDRVGYSNKFFEFIRLGWVAALTGSIMFLVALGAPQGYLDVSRLLRMAGVLSAALVGLGVVGWGWTFAVASDLAIAAESSARGEYQLALDAMQRAQGKLPALSEDTNFIAQTGLLEDALGRNTPAAQLYRADLDELAGKRHQSDLAYQEIVDDTSAAAGIRREACRAVLRSAIDALNSGRANAAAELLEKVLAAEPCNLKANFALQFAYLRTARYQEVPPLAKRLEAVYRHFQFPSRLAVVSASYQNALIADAALGNTNVAVTHGRKVIRP